MTDRPRAPGPPMEDFLGALPEAAGRALLGRLSAGALDARHAAECVPRARTRRPRTAPELLGYLSAAIRELQAAQGIVAAYREGRVSDRGSGRPHDPGQGDPDRERPDGGPEEGPKPGDLAVALERATYSDLAPDGRPSCLECGEPRGVPHHGRCQLGSALAKAFEDRRAGRRPVPEPAVLEELGRLVLNAHLLEPRAGPDVALGACATVGCTRRKRLLAEVARAAGLPESP